MLFLCIAVIHMLLSFRCSSNSQCLSILQFKLISFHVSKSARLFHFYISRINSVIYRMIRWKRKNQNILRRYSLKGWKKTLRKKLLTLAWISGSSFLNLNFLCSCPLLGQTEFLNIALECKIPLGNPRDALPSATDLIHNTIRYFKSKKIIHWLNE